jgi:putative component of membrane protein insertase Oxa1/YidC/SpoIIIJ protein YidD
MQIDSFPSFTRQVGVAAITGYQRYISPHKGFACAYRVLHGGESCSQYFKRVIAEDGFRAAVSLSRQRFHACKQANHILRSHKAQSHNQEQEEQNTSSPKKDSDNSNPSAFCVDNLSSDGSECLTCADITSNCIELFTANPDCSSPDCSSAECGSLDCSGADCSSLDCSGADCSFLDCGSCAP